MKYPHKGFRKKLIYRIDERLANMLIKLITFSIFYYKAINTYVKKYIKIFISIEYTPKKNLFFNFDQFKLSEDSTTKKNIVF